MIMNLWPDVREAEKNLRNLIFLSQLHATTQRRTLIYFFMKFFLFFLHQKNVRLSSSSPKKKNYVKEKSFINTKVIVSHLMRIQFFLLFSLCQFIFLLLYLGSNTLRCFFSFAFFSILQRISLIFLTNYFKSNNFFLKCEKSSNVSLFTSKS